MGVRVSKIEVDLIDIENKIFSEKQLNRFYKNLNSLDKRNETYIDNICELTFKKLKSKPGRVKKFILPFFYV